MTTARGNKIVPYYVCEVFVNMSSGVKLQNLKSKKLCVGCLLPGAVHGPKHKCFFLNFCCPHPFYEKGKNLHVLLFDTHEKEDANIEVLGKFNEKFIKYSKVELPEFSRHLPCSRQLIEIAENFGKNNQAGHASESNTIDSGIFQLQTID